jgi:hypothetical protein
VFEARGESVEVALAVSGGAPEAGQFGGRGSRLDPVHTVDPSLIRGNSRQTGPVPAPQRTSLQPLHPDHSDHAPHAKPACLAPAVPAAAHLLARLLHGQRHREVMDHPHATRVLARVWIRVIYRCWLNHEPYDPARHDAARGFSAWLKQCEVATGGVIGPPRSLPAPLQGSTKNRVLACTGRCGRRR